jgi:hypothetical protein
MRIHPRWIATANISCLTVIIVVQRLAAQDQRTALLDAERAAAETSRDSGFARAILENVHRDGILLWPGAPTVAGVSDLKRFLAGLQAESLHLTWQPLEIDIARDSSLGITWGLALAGASRMAPAPEIGRYIAAWRRDRSRWTIAALVFAGLRLPQPRLNRELPLSRKAIEAHGRAHPFVAADLAFARLAADSGAGVAFERWAAPEAIIFGDRGLLVRGPKAIGRTVDSPAQWSWHPVAAGAAASGDLGWTIGEATIAASGAKPTHSKYLTAWVRLDGGAIRFVNDGGNGRPASP